jgi:23S rRNA pseudouridine1911/1915/1917 synthase
MISAFPVEPVLVAVTDSFLVAAKPPRMHSAPLKSRPVSAAGGPTLLDWCARSYPEVLTVHGRNPWEGGLLHRLDYETSGLTLIARTRSALDALTAAQEAGRFVKEYAALAVKSRETLPSMPLIPFSAETTFANISGIKNGAPPVLIESAFRPYGPGRKAVRPVPVELPNEKTRKKSKSKDVCNQRLLPKSDILELPQLLKEIVPGRLYRTEVLETKTEGEFVRFRLRIYRGFRHQIRCHLAWLGFPLVNDTLYGGVSRPEYPGLALLAQAIAFPDPLSGDVRKYRIGEEG